MPNIELHCSLSLALRLGALLPGTLSELANLHASNAIRVSHGLTNAVCYPLYWPIIEDGAWLEWPDESLWNASQTAREGATREKSYRPQSDTGKE